MNRLLLALGSLASLPAAIAAEGLVTAPTLRVSDTRLPGEAPSVSALPLEVSASLQTGPDALSEGFSSLQVSSSGARSFNDTLSLRGLTNTPIFGDPATTVYVEDIPLIGAFTRPGSLALFSSAELHRGPLQNTRFGRAGEAGVLQLRLPSPAENPDLSLQAGAGSQAARWGSLTTATGSGGRLRALVGLEAEARDGYVTNTTLDQKVDDQVSQSAIARVSFDATDALELALLANAQRARDGAQPMVPLGGPLYTVERSAEGESDLDALNAGLSARYRAAWGSLLATTSLNDWDLSPFSSTLAFAPGMELANEVSLSQRNYNQELRLESAPAASVSWRAGAFYSDGRTDGRFARNFGPYPYENSSYRIDVRQLAAFGELGLPLGRGLNLNLGLRAEDNHKELTRADQLVPSGNYSGLEEGTELLPGVALDYTPNADTRLFASLGAGAKPGGFSAFTRRQDLSAFSAEKNHAAELGATFRSAQGRLETTVRGFWYEIDNYQIERSFQTGTMEDDYLVVNAPKARSTGAELELAWQPLQGLKLSGLLGATKAELRDFTDPYTGLAYDGRRAPYVPCYDAGLRAAYRHARGWFAEAGLNATGRIDYTESNDEAFAQKARCLLDARAGFARDNWSIEIFGRNLSDQAYYASISPGTGHATPGAPLTWGAILACRF